MLRRSVPLLVAFFALTAGCSAPKKPHRLSGFLGDTSALRVQHDRGGILYYEKEGARILEYGKLLLEPPVVLLAPDAERGAAEEEDLAELAAYFASRMREAVEGAYPIVSEPGPDVLRVRAAITEVVPVGTVGHAAEHSNAGVALNIGGAAIEAEVLDSMSGERLAAFADNRSERRFGSLNFLSTWNDAEEAFDDWALRFRHWLDVQHGRAQATPPAER